MLYFCSERPGGFGGTFGDAYQAHILPVVDFTGDEHLEKVIVASKTTGEKTEIPAAGCFIFIGYVPNTRVFKGIIDMNKRGEVLTDQLMQTNVPGVFAAGDLREKRYRQITTSVADGTIAALSAIDFLQQKKTVE